MVVGEFITLLLRYYWTKFRARLFAPSPTPAAGPPGASCELPSCRVAETGAQGLENAGGRSELHTPFSRT
jgi:hypothetical protein